MKKIRLIKYITIITLLVALITGCGNLLMDDITATDNSAAEQNLTGSLYIRLLLPDYDHPAVDATKALSKVISPETRYLRIYLNGDEFMEFPLESGPGDTPYTLITPPPEPTPTPIPTPTPNGPTPPPTASPAPTASPVPTPTPHDGHPVQWEGEVQGVPVGTYKSVTVDLLDADGDTITSGTAFQVDVEFETLTPLLISCQIAFGQYEFLIMGASPLNGLAAAGTMEYYKFYAQAGIEYTVTVTPTVGTPDFYLFSPQGSPTGTVEDVDYTYNGGSLAITAAGTGMYAVGVYGWNGAAEYTIEVESNETTPDPAQPYVDQAFGNLHNQDWDAAFSSFTSALLSNPGNPEAIIGYAALGIIQTLVDPEVIALSQNNLGIVGYPETLNEVFAGDWLEDTFNIRGEYMGDGMWVDVVEIIPIPRISGQEAFDGIFDAEDGLIDVKEKMMAFASFLATNNTGFDDFTYILSDVLGDRLTMAVDAITAANADMQLTITWDMLFDTYAEASAAGWPFFGNTPLQVTIGKAELLAMATALEGIKTFGYMGGVFSTSLVLEDGTSFLQTMWDTMNPTDGTFWEDGLLPADTPFSIPEFLAPSAEAQDYLDLARESLTQACTHMIDALTLVNARTPGDGYFIGPDLEGMDMLPEPWADMQTVFNFEIRAAQEAIDSLTNNTVAYIPMADPDQMAGYLASWPTAIDLANRIIGINLGVLFSNPLAAVIEMAGSGEPVFYALDETVPTFDRLNLFELGLVEPSSQEPYYIRIPDITFGGIIPIGNIPVDDPTTKIRIKVNWDDQWFGEEDPRSNNDIWDAGEKIEGIGVMPDFDNYGMFGSNSGFIEVANLNSYFADDGTTPVTVEEFYDLSLLDEPATITWLNSFLDVDSPLNEFMDVLDIPAFMNYVNNQTEWDINFWIYDWFDLTYKQGNSIFQKIPAFLIWNSVTPGGTLDSATGMVSAGSFWWALIPMPGGRN